MRVLEDNSELRKKMEEVVSHPTEFLQLDIGNGISMDAWMIKPKDFDESKKYPVFIYVYGEPYAQTVLDSWGAAQIDFHRVVADLGYLGRIDRQPGHARAERSGVAAIHLRQSGPAVHRRARGGTEGAGAHATRTLICLGSESGAGAAADPTHSTPCSAKPDSYHVGIAVVPKPQPHLYNAWFQEIYMRTREVNPDGYQRAAAINYADGLKGKLLMITGSGETNTHIQIIEGLVDRLIELGKPFDYMVYPNRDHGLREGLGTSVHVRMLIIRYLARTSPAGTALETARGSLLEYLKLQLGDFILSQRGIIHPSLQNCPSSQAAAK